MMAGTLTTAWTLEVIMFWLLSQPSTLLRLKEELRKAIPGPEYIGTLPLPTLEQLPYLNAVMKEGLRLTYGVSCRLARIDPDNPIEYVDPATNRTWHIQTGTPVGLTGVQIHHDETIFPSSKTFSPERWLDSSGQPTKDLDRYMVRFRAGSRQCMGINLAHAELYLCLSAVWRVLGSRVVRGEGDVGW
jgi:cytochrome P450